MICRGDRGPTGLFTCTGFPRGTAWAWPERPRQRSWTTTGCVMSEGMGDWALGGALHTSHSRSQRQDPLSEQMLLFVHIPARSLPKPSHSTATKLRPGSVSWKLQSPPFRFCPSAPCSLRTRWRRTRTQAVTSYEHCSNAPCMYTMYMCPSALLKENEVEEQVLGCRWGGRL